MATLTQLITACAVLLTMFGMATCARAATPAELWADTQRLMGWKCQVSRPGRAFLCDGPPAVRVREMEYPAMVGYFDPYTNPREVLISPRLNDRPTMRDSFIVHELVHYLQWIRGELHASRSCEQDVESEVQAYDVQSRWLVEKTGAPFPPDRLLEIMGEHTMACTYESLTPPPPH